MKKINKTKLLFVTVFTITSFFLLTSSFSAKIISIYYYKEPGYDDRTPTYTYPYLLLGPAGWIVNGYDNIGTGSIQTHLNNSSILVVHNHGGPGRQFLKSPSYAISGTNGNGTTILAVSSMPGNTSKSLGIAIYYGCKTGDTSSSYGDLMQQTVNKYAKSSVAWKVDTYILEVNEWNRFFFIQAANRNNTVAYALSQADTQLAASMGAVAGNRMKNQRIERGSFTWTFNSVF